MFNTVVLGYVLLCFSGLLYWFFREKRGVVSSVSRFLIILFLPILGLIYIFVSDRLERLDDKDKDKVMDLENIFTIESQPVYIHRPVNIARETNLVPLEESLLINDVQTKRRLLLDALKEESLQRISLLEMGLKDEDTETSHYAATALVEVMRKLMMDLQKLEIRFEEDPFDLEMLLSYAEVLKRFLSIRLLDQRTYRKYFYQYALVLEKLLEVDQTKQDYFIEKINCEIQNQNFELVRKYCQRFQAAFPNEETPYMMKLKYCFEARNSEEFNQTLRELKASPIKLSPKGLKMVRFWGEGAG